MREEGASAARGDGAGPVGAAIKLLEDLIIDGIRHGHFEYCVTCETGNGGRRLLIVKAGKSHKFSILEADIPR